MPRGRLTCLPLVVRSGSAARRHAAVALRRSSAARLRGVSDESRLGRVLGEFEPVYEELLVPVEGELRREPVSDADAPCPRCGQRSWLLIEKRADPEAARTRWRAAACASCGAADGWEAAGRLRAGRRDNDDVEWESPFEDVPTVAELLEKAEFAVACPSGAARVVAYGWEDEAINQVSLAGDDLHVTTRLRQATGWPDPLVVVGSARLAVNARQALISGLRDRDRFVAQPRSRAAEEVAYQAWHREIVAIGEAAPVDELRWCIGETRVTFLVAASRGCWGAATEVPPREITIRGSGEPPDDLQLIAMDPHA